MNSFINAAIKLPLGTGAEVDFVLGTGEVAVEAKGKENITYQDMEPHGQARVVLRGGIKAYSQNKLNPTHGFRSSPV